MPCATTAHAYATSLARGGSGLAGPPLLGLRNGEERPIKLVPIKLRAFFPPLSRSERAPLLLLAPFPLPQSVSQSASQQQTKARGLAFRCSTLFVFAFALDGPYQITP